MYMNIAFFEVQPWEEKILQHYFPDSIFSREPLSEHTIDAYSNVEIISCFIYSNITEDTIKKLPNLKFISTRSTGYDHIDIQSCTNHMIQVANVPDYGSHTVAEHTFALILTLTRKIHQSINQAKELNFNHAEIKGVDLYGKTLGIMGLGKIGIEVLKIAKGFGMNVFVYSRTEHPELASQYNFTYTDLDSLIASSDIVTLHLPYNAESHHIITTQNILRFKKGSYLINTARGGLIETEALIMGLQQEILAGIGLDVLEEEKELTEEIDILTSSYAQTAHLKTLVLDHHLINHPKVIITPHNAFNSQEALQRILEVTIQNIQAFMNNTVQNSVT